jgi:uncharacterized iron-regulated membrane protein
MANKLVTLTVLLICLFGALLWMRHRRIELAHRSTELHWRIERARHDLWETEVRVNRMLRPEELRQRIERTQIVFEPALPEPATGPGSYARGE